MLLNLIQRTPLQKKLLAVFGVLFLSIFLFSATLIKDINDLESTSKWLNHTHQVIGKAHKLLKLMIDQETGLRGYLIVGKENFLEPFHSGKSEFDFEIKQLKLTVSDNPSQVALLNEIEKLAQQWHLQAAQPEIEERKRIIDSGKDNEFLQELIAKGTGKSILDKQRATIKRLQRKIESSQTLNQAGNRHAAEILAISLIKHMVDQETGQRGFLITGKETYLEPLLAGRKSFKLDIEKLKRLKGMDDDLLDVVSEVEMLSQEWQQQAAGPQISARRQVDSNQSSMAKVTAIVESEIGKQTMDELREKVSQFVENEEILIIERKNQNDEQHKMTMLAATLGGIFLVILALLIIYVVNRTSKPLIKLIGEMRQISESSDFTRRIQSEGMYEVNRIAEVFNRMALNTEQQAWLKTSALDLSRVLQQSTDTTDLAEELTSRLGDLLSIGFGAFYLFNRETERYELIGSYCFKERKHAETAYALGEGLVGQCALEKNTLLLNGVPQDYTQVHSGLGESLPDTVIAVPVVFDNQTLAVIELATFGGFSKTEQTLLEEQVANIALGLRSLLNSVRTKELLEQTQAQAEELQVREEELNDSNTLLERQAKELLDSQEELKKSNAELTAQQEELRVANEELEEKANDLNASQVKLEEQNLALDEAKREVEKKADALSISSKYKSEFLANMSHELRTPLNSLLILSKLLMDNKEGNLNNKQVDYARTVHDSGEDLLNLINDILDLSKIESGRMEVIVDQIKLTDFVSSIEKKFMPMAEKKGIAFTINQNEAPQQWSTDIQKLNQIIKNLLSNAIKFTDQGSVTIDIGPTPDSLQLMSPKLANQETMAISVTDTGIGIPDEKRHVIFEAFQQADGTTSRKYGGTGLGLSISRELAQLLQGEIHLQSETGQGSRFTLVIPSNLVVKTPQNTPSPSKATVRSPQPNAKQVTASTENTAKNTTETQATLPIEADTPLPQIEDDRDKIQPGDKALLIIEDDARFAAITAEVAQEKGFAVLLAETGTSGIQLANQYLPSGIILDIGLPDLSGLEVMNRLKSQANTRHIPIHVMSASDRNPDAMKSGAIGFYTKPVSIDDLEHAFTKIEDLSNRPVKQLLIVEDDEIQVNSLKALLGGKDVAIQTASDGETAEKRLKEQPFDCIVLDLGLPDMNGLELLETLRNETEFDQVPVVIYSGRELEPKERALLDQYAQSVIIKNAKSPERLLDDTTLFLHRVEEDLPEKQRQTIHMLHDTEKLFRDKKVLLVDDDMRNIFSLSAVLQEKNIDVHTAANGVEALEQLDANPDISLVLMDIMMPEMDGYEAMRRIRAQDRFKSLPMIALTAKAMKGDRTLCIEAGASDYLAKPVDTEKLLSIMRVWLYQ